LVAVIEVHDTGVGMDKDLLSRVFDPFFTTKQLGMGTGLGLSIARDIVNRHHGSITCQSTPNVGTEFHIVLPLTTRADQDDELGRLEPTKDRSLSTV
jgi:signal transduction histidine kinase